MKLFLNISCFLLVTLLSQCISKVPTKRKAIKIAEKEWLNAYGEAALNKKPYNCRLVGDSVWLIYGTMPESGWYVNENGDSAIQMNVGGVPRIKLRKDDGTILEIGHSK